MIKLIVNNQELSIVTQKVVSGTHDYLTVEADFKGSAWTGLRKWVHFTMGQFSYILPMTDDTIDASMHLDLTEGTWQVYVHGNLATDDDVVERITTDIKYLYVDAPHDGHPFPPLTPDFEELLANQVAEANEMSSRLWELYEEGSLTDGATFIPSVDEEGNISWTNDKFKPNPEPRNIKGPQGATGNSGVYIGTIEPTDPDVNVWVNPEGGHGKVITKVTTTGTHAQGTTDTYKFDFSDDTSLTITVYNGVDGAGAGDMVKATYDTGNKQQDIFDYADNAAAAVKDKTAITGLLKGLAGAIVQAVAGTDYVAPSDLADVATSGSYNDLLDKPTIPTGSTVDTALSNSSTNPVQNKVVKQAIDGITTRPNPQALTINVNGSVITYDGSTAKSVSIDTSGSGGGGSDLLVRQIGFVFNSSSPIPAGGWNYKQIDASYSGYTPIAVAGFSMPGYLVAAHACHLNGTTLNVDVVNTGSTDVTGNGWVNVLYKKN